MVGFTEIQCFLLLFLEKEEICSRCGGQCHTITMVGFTEIQCFLLLFLEKEEFYCRKRILEGCA
jgi:hypothetical protein